VFVSFNLLTFLFWLLVSSFVPGAVLSFALFRKNDFSFLEKLFSGFALGFILLPLIPFLLYFIAGVNFSYEIALLSIALLYVIAIAFFVKNKAYEGLKMPESLNLNEIVTSKQFIISVLLVLVLVSSYMVRIGSYGPIFQELDPYYYTYPAQQLLVDGYNMPDDQTAWYPELEVSHRIIPAISYLEATWFELYTGGGEYSNMLLSALAGMYPPIAAMLSVFFIYLFVSIASKREWGLAAAGIAAFVPVFVYKLAAGEMETQPYAFFSLFFLYAMYALSLKTKDLKFSVLAGLGFAAVALGSSSQLLALASIMIFMVIQALATFLKKEDSEELMFLLKSNAIIFVLGPLLGSAVLKDIFYDGSAAFTIIIPFLIALASIGVLYLLKTKIPDQQKALTVLGAIAVLGILVFAFTPLGDFVKGIGKSGFGLSEFRRPLDRTIAEQGVAPTAFGGQIGFVADTYVEENRPAVVSSILWPIVIVFNAISPSLGDTIGNLVGTLISLILLPISVVVNVIFTLIVALLNAVLGTTVDYVDKANSFMLLWIFLFWAALSYSVYQYVKKDEDNMFLLFLAIIMPPFLVGIIKAKYTIYSAVLLAVAIGFTLGVAKNVLDTYFEGRGKQALYVIAVLLVLFQFVYNGFSVALIAGSVVPLYQNDPMALQAKFQGICDSTSDSVVCAAAADPMGYAAKGTNYQYNQKLCLLSIYSDYTSMVNSGSAPEWERTAAFFRCQRLSTYWIDSMEWLKENTPEDSRVISWWDYGHWINYFADRNSVLRNEHRSHEMIGAVADGYLDATPEELAAYMKSHETQYALFDVELVAGGGQLGGKYGALNYLSCAWNNETNVSFAPGQSTCEADHLWEVIFISQTPCSISTLSNKSGLTAYKIYEGGVYRTFYRSECMSPSDQNTAAYCQSAIKAEPVYCVGETTLANGQPTTATYYMNETYPNGDLKLNKAMLQFPYSIPMTTHMGPVTSVTLLYTEDALWLENGVIKSGYEDRKGKFYDSTLYRGIFLNNIPGFSQVYATSDGAVKIYKVAE
jgi:asparagine N-glycosylation enzyme membrane subunit Stt3